MKKKLLILLVLVLTLTSCRLDVSPQVEVKNDINLTIDGENLDGFEGEWTITREKKDKDGKVTIIITIEKKEIN